MTTALELYVSGTPAPKGSFRVVTRARGGASLPFPRVLKDSKKTEVWHAAVKTAAMQLCAAPPFRGVPLRVSIVFYLSRPRGHFTKKGYLKVRAPVYPAVKPDLDKLVRATLDPLESVVFDGDSRIVDLMAIKRYAIRHDTGAEIYIEVMK